MRIIVVADIHGNDDKFRQALKSVSLKKTDKLILLGDLIDRGKNSKKVLDTLLLLKSNGFENITYIRGNHEQMLLDAIDNEEKEYIWIKNGGDETLKSFRVNFANEIPYVYKKLLESSTFFLEYENYFFVHAGLNFELENPLIDTNSMMWIRDISFEMYKKSTFSSKIIIHGHTPIQQNQIRENLEKNNIINLDNGVYIKKEHYGKLTIVDLTNKKLIFI
ncbi:metallophosphoesterase family protein [Chryseobacterium taihuense]|uniref:Serine/threonine protein phosphatase 1 n=1 Tax=Chryseobacterium taihuense TaxID=1141221 RepID=A0ABY0QPT5_9FLAO|nr:metallophosphoesterase family protein [Chryseobacterium taihuense]SDL45694.1 serine/threonine protein phosphatase 1 [Chryseobacterium taihuense]